jgi:1-acyl-sn-glycerol-3-phosphate acyltransferase
MPVSAMRGLKGNVWAVLVIAAATWGSAECVRTYADAPGWLRIGMWQWPALAGALLVFSHWRFGSVMPGLLGGCAGSLFLLALWFFGQAIATSGLLAPLFGLLPVALALYACERQVGRRCAAINSYAWILVAVASFVPVAALLEIIRPDGDVQELPLLVRCGHAIFDALSAAVLMGMVAMLLYGIAIPLWSVVRALFPAPGRWPADGATVLNSLCGYATFALSCLTLPLFLPLSWVLPGGREYWIAAAMRRAMRWVFWMTPTVTWKVAGEVAALDGARVVVANHEGMLDILVACALPGTRTLLAKTWVFRAFPLGVGARAAGLRNSDLLVPDDYLEGDATSPVLEPGLGLFVFPEGRRSRSGAIDRFRPGAFVLARSLDAPVVPVAIAASRQGIRPGSMWIHPTRLVSHVLPPMRPLADESMRQFAARVREAIAAQRLVTMRGLLRHPRLARSHRHLFTGLPYAWRSAAHAEYAQGVWRLLAATVRDVPGAWLQLGCGWSALAVTVRQLLPATPIHAVEADEARRSVALHAWFVPETDVVVPTAAELSGDGPLTGVACLLPDDEVTAAIAAVAPRCAGGVVLVRRSVAEPWRAALAGHGAVTELAGDAQWTVLAAG